MFNYIGRRLLASAPVLLGILLISYIFVRMIPGDPVRAMMDPERAAASAEYIARRRSELGLDDSVIVQFVAWLVEVLQGNLGYSFRGSVSVSEMIGGRIGPTVLLASTALVLSLLVGVVAGVIAALKQNTWFDYLSGAASMLGISIPTFFLGLMVIYVFAIWLDILPSGGLRTITATEATVGDNLRHLVLPAGILAANLSGPFVRFTRQGVLEVLRQDYVATARAKGVPYRMIIVSHVLRNSLIPLVTVIALQVPALLTGVLIIEVVFSWPGLGLMTYEAVGNRDYPVVTSMVLVSGALVILFNLLADVLTALLDPRIRV